MKVGTRQGSPAPEPAARRGVSLRCWLLRSVPSRFATLRPMSTLGPSGPREAPVPSVRAAATARRRGAKIFLIATPWRNVSTCVEGLCRPQCKHFRCQLAHLPSCGTLGDFSFGGWRGAAPPPSPSPAPLSPLSLHPSLPPLPHSPPSPFPTLPHLPHFPLSLCSLPRCPGT